MLVESKTLLGLEDVSTLVRTPALKAAWVFHVSGSQAWAGVAGVNIDISTASMVAIGIAFLNIPIFISRKKSYRARVRAGQNPQHNMLIKYIFNQVSAAFGLSLADTNEFN
jgi:hypothetical protein